MTAQVKVGQTRQQPYRGCLSCPISCPGFLAFLFYREGKGKGGQAAGSSEPLDFCEASNWSSASPITAIEPRASCRSSPSRVSDQRLTVLGFAPTKRARACWDRLRPDNAARISRGVFGQCEGNSMAHAPKAKARTMQNPMKANAATRSKRARAASNMIRLFQV